MPDFTICKQPWVAPILPAEIPHGDMPGDKVSIQEGHIQKAGVIFPALCDLLEKTMQESPTQRAVVSVCGGSGVGKSEIASLLSFYLNAIGIGAYTLSGDNYPHRIPLYNDAERLRVFRVSGIRGLLDAGLYDEEVRQNLDRLLQTGTEADPKQTAAFPWLSTYQSAGRSGLSHYLGTQNEIDFAEISEILARFRSSEDTLMLKRMGREETALWYDRVDMRQISVLVVEWTHGNNDLLRGVDIPIFLHSTPQETLEHRRLRARDGALDSPFTTMVLELEQALLQSQAKKAKIIVNKGGALLTQEEYRALSQE